MNALKHIQELEVQSEMLFNMASDIKNKAIALRRELARRGTLSNSPSSEEDEEFMKKASRILHNRKKALTRASVKNKKKAQ